MKLGYYAKDDNDTEIKNVIRIYGLENSLNLLSSNDITQYFIDRTYKCLPNLIPSTNVLIIVIGYNANIDRYIQFYSLLKSKFKFKPKRITCDSCKTNLLAITEVFMKKKL